MAISDAVIVHSGSKSTSTLGGQIRIEEGAGRMVVYNPTTQREITVIDDTGFLFADASDRRIQEGIAPDDGRVGHWISKPGEDVIDLLDS